MMLLNTVMNECSFWTHAIIFFYTFPVKFYVPALALDRVLTDIEIHGNLAKLFEKFRELPCG